MRERWKKIPCYDGYEVSNKGRVRSFYQMKSLGYRYGCFNSIGKKAKLLKTPLNLGGYPVVTLRKGPGEKQEVKKVHHCVLFAFVGPKPKGYCGCHNNGIPTDCRLDNLRWDTYKSNIADKKKHGTHLIGFRVPSAKLSEKEVKKIIELLDRGDSFSKIATQFKVTMRIISLISSGELWIHVKRPPKYVHPKPRGERNARSILGEKDVLQIKKLLAQGVKQSVIALRFKVSPSNISLIKRKRVWSFVEI